MFLSMSMSLSMLLDHNPVNTLVTEPTPPPTVQTTQSPTPKPRLNVTSVSSIPAKSSLVDEHTDTLCMGVPHIVTALLEVETVIGKDDFAGDLEITIRAALEHVYSFCGASRLPGYGTVEDGSIGDVSIVALIHGKQAVGKVTIQKTPETHLCISESCTVGSSLAKACFKVTADFEVYGDGINMQYIRDSLGAFFSDGDFDDIVLTNGIMDVRLREDSITEALNTETTFNAPLIAEDNAYLGGDKPKTAAILAALTGTILVAAILTKLKRR
jgi:hypothetical protein